MDESPTPVDGDEDDGDAFGGDDHGRTDLPEEALVSSVVARSGSTREVLTAIRARVAFELDRSWSADDIARLALRLERIEAQLAALPAEAQGVSAGPDQPAHLRILAGGGAS